MLALPLIVNHWTSEQSWYELVELELNDPVYAFVLAVWDPTNGLVGEVIR